jgi:uncharacterized membrane protein YjdF
VETRPGSEDRDILQFHPRAQGSRVERVHAESPVSTPAQDEFGPHPFRIIGLLGTAAFLAISFMPRGDGPGNYKLSFLFLVPGLWALYALRKRLRLHPLHFGLFASALVLHDLGAFGLYTEKILGLEFDWYVHFYYGLVLGLIIARGVHLEFGLRGLGLALAVVLLVTGLGGLHEIVEGASTRFLGQEYGMLKVEGGNPYDTQEDLFNNVLGSLVAFFAYTAVVRRRAGPQSYPS